MTERRTESRFLCADLVRAEWTHPALTRRGVTRQTEAVLEDISALGACIQVEEPIPVGAEIGISAGDTQLFGTVSYSVFRDYGFFVGIRFPGETRWSEGLFVPQHLTSLEALGFGAFPRTLNGERE